MPSPEEIQQRMVDELTRQETDPPAFAHLLDPFQYVASANYVVPMLLHLAHERGDEIVDEVPAYSSLDHAVNWQVLVAAIARFEDFMAPYFDWAILPDPFAQELLAYEEGKHHRRHVLASFNQKLWRLRSDKDGLRVSLTEPARRSALHVISNLVAEHALYPPALRELFQRPRTDRDLREVTLAARTFALDIFAQSAPASWESLCAGLGFDMEMVPPFRAWVIGLKYTARRWFSPSELWDDWAAFARKEGIDCGTHERFEALAALHTVTPDEAKSWGVQAPFLRCGNFLAVWSFAFHVLLPDLGLLSLIIRRHEQLWSTTVGSTLALAADWLGGRLPSRSRLVWTARRSRRGVGDADLVLWDRETNDVVVLELKTTFDKFRSHAQLRNFVEQRVNFPRAIMQARRVAAAISDGSWKLRDLFGASAPVAPRSVTPGVLTWWDTFNPTLGTVDEVLCCNFATFAHVTTAAEGNLVATVTAIRELAKIYCPGVLVPSRMSVGGQEWRFRREVQRADLPPAATWGPVSALTAELLRPLGQWSPDWRSDDGEELPGRRFVYDD